MRIPRLNVSRRPAIVGLLLFAYLASYQIITTASIAQASEWGLKGFYYQNLENATSKSWESKEQILAVFYWPMSTIEFDLLGLGRPHAYPPLVGLSK
jgi:hypothetical protein